MKVFSFGEVLWDVYPNKKCIGRSKGRNVLISIIALVIAVFACLGLSIRQAAESAKESTLSELSITATINRVIF